MQQMESARVVKPDEVATGHLTPAEFWGALTIRVCLAHDTPRVDRCCQQLLQREGLQGVVCYFLSEVDSTAQCRLQHNHILTLFDAAARSFICKPVGPLAWRATPPQRAWHQFRIFFLVLELD
jgi:hypothetical protein